MAVEETVQGESHAMKRVRIDESTLGTTSVFGNAMEASVWFNGPKSEATDTATVLKDLLSSPQKMSMYSKKIQSNPNRQLARSRQYQSQATIRKPPSVGLAMDGQHGSEPTKMSDAFSAQKLHWLRLIDQFRLNLSDYNNHFTAWKFISSPDILSQALDSLIDLLHAEVIQNRTSFGGEIDPTDRSLLLRVESFVRVLSLAWALPRSSLLSMVLVLFPGDLAQVRAVVRFLQAVLPQDYLSLREFAFNHQSSVDAIKACVGLLTSAGNDQSASTDPDPLARSQEHLTLLHRCGRCLIDLESFARCARIAICLVDDWLFVVWVCILMIRIHLF